jgi:hypothetical protein
MMMVNAGRGLAAARLGTVALLKGEFSLLPDVWSESELTYGNRWCGKGKDYCTAPDCQINYGTGCDAVWTTLSTLVRL